MDAENRLVCESSESAAFLSASARDDRMAFIVSASFQNFSVVSGHHIAYCPATESHPQNAHTAVYSIDNEFPCCCAHEY